MNGDDVGFQVGLSLGRRETSGRQPFRTLPVNFYIHFVGRVYNPKGVSFINGVWESANWQRQQLHRLRFLNSRRHWPGATRWRTSYVD
jgi:hypothetical protein